MKKEMYAPVTPLTLGRNTKDVLWMYRKIKTNSKCRRYFPPLLYRVREAVPLECDSDTSHPAIRRPLANTYRAAELRDL